MSAVAGPLVNLREDYRRLAAELPGASTPWVRRLREQALERFHAAGLPGPRDEDWKYTRLDLLQQRAWSWVLPPAEISPQAIARLPLAGLSPHRMVFIDGHFSPSLSSLAGLPPQVTCASLAAVLNDTSRTLEELPNGESAGADAFEALNSALMSDGAYIDIPARCVLESPLHLQFVSTGTEGRGICPRVIVRAEAASHVCIVETHVSLGAGAVFKDGYTSMRLERDAHVEHYVLQLESAQTLEIAATRISQDAGSRYESHLLLLGARLMRRSLHADLAGEGAECLFNGLFFPRERQHHDVHTRIEHLVPRCTSREYFRGIADGRGRGVFDGRVTVHPGAQLTDAQLHSRNLLLSRQAEIDVKPQLEIYADDVKCSHGATVGQLDEDALFYLRARGLDEAQARTLAIYAFANEILDRFGRPGIRAEARGLLLGHMPQGEQLRGLS